MRCYFHTDLDGHCSAAIVYHFVGNGDFIEVDYRDQIDTDSIQNEDVIIVDFSFKPDVMAKVLEKTNRIWWIDHHVTAKEYSYGQKLDGLRDFADKSRAACELTWEYFTGTQENMPDAVKFIGDYDKWALKLVPTSTLFYEGMKLEKNGPKDEIWKLLFDNKLSEPWVKTIIENGEIGIKYRDNYCKDIREKNAYEIELDGYRGIALNLYGFGSASFGEMFGEHDFVLSYIHDGKIYVVSLYSTKIDVGKLIQDIGAKHGALSAGGHKGASGATFDKMPPFLRKT